VYGHIEEITDLHKGNVIDQWGFYYNFLQHCG